MNRDEVSANGALPPIVIPAGDYSRLVALAESAERNAPQVGDFLSRELERARIVEDAVLDDEVVRVGSLVTYRDAGAGQERTVRLVWPPDADVQRNRISVISLVGAALLGMSVGQAIQWPSPVDGTRTLSVVAVQHAQAGMS